MATTSSVSLVLRDMDTTLGRHEWFMQFATGNMPVPMAVRLDMNWPTRNKDSCGILRPKLRSTQEKIKK